METNEDIKNDLLLIAVEQSHHDVSFNEIEELLLKKTDNKNLVDDIIREVKKNKYAANRKKGLKKLGLASALLVTGFLITCINFHSNQSFTIVMYSFTSVGLIVMLWGLYDIIG